MELWVGSISFSTIETIILLVCGGIILYYLIGNDSKEKYKSAYTKYNDNIVLNIVGVVLAEIKRRNVDINEEKVLIDVLTRLSLDENYREKFLRRNSDDLLEASRKKNVEKIISILRKEIL